MNVVITRKLYQTVFPAVIVRKIKKWNSQTNSPQSLRNFPQPGLCPVLHLRTHQVNPLQYPSSTPPHWQKSPNIPSTFCTFHILELDQLFTTLGNILFRCFVRACRSHQSFCACWWHLMWQFNLNDLEIYMAISLDLSMDIHGNPEYLRIIIVERCGMKPWVAEVKPGCVAVCCYVIRSDTIRDRYVVRASLSTSSGIDGSRYEVRAILDRWVRIKYMHISSHFF